MWLNKTKLIHISTQVEVISLVRNSPENRLSRVGGGGWVAGSIETKAISASNLKLKLTEVELGNF